MRQKVYGALRWTVVVGCFGWMGVVGWAQFRDVPERELLTHSSRQVQERLTSCDGTFKQRYDCKSTIVLQTERQTIWHGVVRLAMVVLPPLAAAAAFIFLVPKPALVRRRFKPLDLDDEDPDVWLERTRMTMRAKTEERGPDQR